MNSSIDSELKKVLIIGFSVTADSNGYVPKVKKYFSDRDEGVVVDYCGVGGVTPFCIQSLYNVVNEKRGPYTHVFLEIATSIYSRTIKSIVFDGLDLIYDLFYQIQRSGAEVSVIAFYRNDTDYQYNFFDMLLESLCSRYRIPLLDLAGGLIRERGRDFCQTLLRDAVHTSESGAIFQSTEVIKFIKKVAFDSLLNAEVPPPRFSLGALALTNFPGKVTAGIFRRSGLEIPYIEIHENNVEEIFFDKNVRITGVAFLSGPKCGKLAVKFFPSEEKIVIDAYDEHCFYERYNFHRLTTPIWCTSLSISQLPGSSPVTLRRGEVDSGPRVGRVVAAHTLKSMRNS